MGLESQTGNTDGEVPGGETVEGAGVEEQSTEQSGGAAAEGAAAAGEGAGKEGSSAKPGEKGEEPPKTALEAARRATERGRKAAEAVQAGKDAAPASKAKEGGKPEGGEQGSEDLTGRIEDDEWKALPERTRRRISAFRGEIRTLKETAQRNAPKVETYEQLESYIRSSGMARDDFVEALEIMSLTKKNPAEAWKRLQPIITTLRTHVGEVLPDDLAEAVAAGTMSEDGARSLAFERAERARLAAEVRSRDERGAAEAASRQAAEVQGAMVETIRSLENTWKATDPDYAKKAELVWERMVTLMSSERQALSPEIITGIAKRAMEDVNKRLSGFVPAPKPKTPITENGGAGNVHAAPKNALEAARQALRAMAA